MVYRVVLMNDTLCWSRDFFTSPWLEKVMSWSTTGVTSSMTRMTPCLASLYWAHMLATPLYCWCFSASRPWTSSQAALTCTNHQTKWCSFTLVYTHCSPHCAPHHVIANNSTFFNIWGSITMIDILAWFSISKF